MGNSFNKSLEKRFKEAAGKKGRKHELNLSEFTSLLNSCLLRDVDAYDNVDVKEIFSHIDADNNDSVSFQELLCWMAVYKRGTEEERLHHLFDTFDEDENGYLEREEILVILEIIKEAKSDEGATIHEAVSYACALVEEMDVDGDGKISRTEWVSIGKRSGVVNALLGSDFIKLLNEFDVTGKVLSKTAKSMSIVDAVEAGEANVTRFHLRNGVGPNILAHAENKYTLLHLASQRGHINVLQALVDYKANVNDVDAMGCNSLHHAALNGHGDAVRFLLTCGADPHRKTPSGYSPKDYAEGDTLMAFEDVA